jgi:hypothetical protein
MDIHTMLLPIKATRAIERFVDLDLDLDRQLNFRGMLYRIPGPLSLLLKMDVPESTYSPGHRTMKTEHYTQS